MALYEIAKTLGLNGVNIEYLYTTLIDEKPVIILRVDNNGEGVEVLRKKGLEVLEDFEA